MAVEEGRAVMNNLGPAVVPADAVERPPEGVSYFLAPGGSKAPLLKMSDALEYFAESSFLKKLSAVNRSSPAVQAS